ncbi:MAG: hypothetical protein CMM01_23990 [Rhodopirellula sp.]|nr:hypothetical protein [Rhodopirellula sp.]
MFSLNRDDTVSKKRLITLKFQHLYGSIFDGHHGRLTLGIVNHNFLIAHISAPPSALPLDPETLKATDDKGIRVRPEHIDEALQQFGDDIADYEYSQQFPLGVKPPELRTNFWQKADTDHE